MINANCYAIPINKIKQKPAMRLISKKAEARLTYTIMDSVLGVETAKHCYNTAEIVHGFTKYLQKNFPLKKGGNTQEICKIKSLSAEDMNNIKIAAFLHDIGKSKIPDQILYKKNKLSKKEFNLIKSHTLRGKEILEKWFGKDNMFAHIAECHHEKANGAGYYGKKAKLTDQIIGLADVWEALTAKRSYKKALPPSKVLSMLREDTQKGKFDKDLFGLFESFLSECAGKKLPKKETHFKLDHLIAGKQILNIPDA